MSALEKQDVLVIEDDASIRNLLLHSLQRLGIRCEAAADGLEGAHRIHEAEYTVVLLDVMMPRVDGFGFLVYLREWEKSSGKRPLVLLMTAEPPDRQKLDEVADVVQAVVAKPFDLGTISVLCQDCVAARSATLAC